MPVAERLCQGRAQKCVREVLKSVQALTAVRRGGERKVRSESPKVWKHLRGQATWVSARYMVGRGREADRVDGEADEENEAFGAIFMICTLSCRRREIARSYTDILIRSAP